jgi:hypothetical protein
MRSSFVRMQTLLYCQARRAGDLPASAQYLTHIAFSGTNFDDGSGWRMKSRLEPSSVYPGWASQVLAPARLQPSCSQHMLGHCSCSLQNLLVVVIYN